MYLIYKSLKLNYIEFLKLCLLFITYDILCMSVQRLRSNLNLKTICNNARMAYCSVFS